MNTWKASLTQFANSNSLPILSFLGIFIFPPFLTVRKLTPSLCHELFIHLEEVKFKANEAIIQSEENSDMFYIIEQGEVEKIR